MFKHRLRDPASVNAMKQTCVIYFAWFQLFFSSLNIPFLTLDFSKQNGVNIKYLNVITSSQRQCNMQTNQGPDRLCQVKSHVQIARESHDLNMVFYGCKQLCVTNSYARIYIITVDQY